MKEIALYVMSVFYVAAGIFHFVRPGMYMRIMPQYLPFHLPLVYISGIFEIVCGLLLLHPVSRPLGAWLTIATLIAILPANIQMLVDFYQKQNPYLWATILRIPLQFVLIWWAWLYTR
jgi:uncharacterized membrane protein